MAEDVHGVRPARRLGGRGQADRHARGVHGLRVLADLVEQDGEVRPGSGDARVELDRLAIRRDRPGKLALALQRHAALERGHAPCVRLARGLGRELELDRAAALGLGALGGRAGLLLGTARRVGGLGGELLAGLFDGSDRLRRRRWWRRGWRWLGGGRRRRGCRGGRRRCRTRRRGLRPACVPEAPHDRGAPGERQHGRDDCDRLPHAAQATWRDYRWNS
jgi:hypothetical protein